MQPTQIRRTLIHLGTAALVATAVFAVTTSMVTVDSWQSAGLVGAVGGASFVVAAEIAAAILRREDHRARLLLLLIWALVAGVVAYRLARWVIPVDSATDAGLVGAIVGGAMAIAALVVDALIKKSEWRPYADARSS